MIDCHCHLDHVDYKKLEGGVDGVVQRAKSAGLKFVISASTNFKAAEDNLILREKFFPFVQVLAGLSPHHSIEEIEKLEDHLKFISANKSKIVGIGEIGLDFHHFHKEEEWNIQKKAFLAQLQVAETYDLPVIIHSRKAEKECLDILGNFKVRVMLHCFSTHQLAEGAVAKKYFISIPTLKSKGIEKSVKKAPLENILCETDAPWLWPTWPSEPANVKFSYETVAKAKKLSFEEVERKIDENAIGLFGLK